MAGGNNKACAIRRVMAVELVDRHVNYAPKIV